MRTVVCHQPIFVPWLGFFEKVARADVLVLLDGVQMESGGFENRNRIRTREGWQWLTVPVMRTGSYQRIADVRIAHTQPWARKHLRAIELAYARAPQFGEWMPRLKQLYRDPPEHLAAFDFALIDAMLDAVDIDVPIVWQTDLALPELRGNEALISICKAVGASRYVFGACGADYVNPEMWARAGLTYEVQQYRHPTYRQAWPGFEPHMSAIDLLMNYPGDEARAVIMNGGEA